MLAHSLFARLARTALVALPIAFASVAPARAAGPPPVQVRVLVPDDDNLQYLAFWVARGAGYFDAEGVAVELTVPYKPVLAQSAFERGEAEVAVLSPPMYLRLVAEKFPCVLVANLLQNDPIDLVVRRSVAEARGIRAEMPLKQRLEKLRGLRLGVAPGPPTRLRVLFSTQGLDVDKELDVVTIHGADQNDAFAARKVDALYAHTPYLETALVDQGAVVVVNQSGGELPALAARQIHALVVTRAFAAKEAPVVAAMTRAIYRAELLVHADHAATVEAVLRAIPAYERRHVTKLVELYDPAVPTTPRVSSAGFAQALALYPASGAPPDLQAIDRASFVDSHFADDAVTAITPAPALSTHRRALYGLILGGVILALAIALREQLR